MGSPVLGCARLALYLTWTVLLIPVQALAVALGWGLRDRLPRFYHRVCVRILGFEVRVAGRLATARPTLVVANHSSYLDIMLLGSLIPGSFVAKTEVADWPFFGLLAKLQRTVFVDRARRSGTRRQTDDLRRRLEAGDTLILFPEGTSSDGNRTLPFKTALFGVAGAEVSGRKLVVQPVSIAATALDGIPLGRGLRPLYAWYGDMLLLPHLWRMACQGRLAVTVEFHEPVTLDRFRSRKALADHCQDAVARGVARAIAGRPPAEVPA